MIQNGLCITTLWICCISIPQAGVFTVNTTGDGTDIVPGDGVCETGAGNGICPLRAAIQETNALVGADILHLLPGSYVLTIPGILEDLSAAGDLDITDDLAITGTAPANTILDGATLDRVLDVDPTALGITVELSRVTIVNGDTTMVGTNDRGGGIRNRGDLTLKNVTLRDNTSIGGGGVSNASPGILSISNAIVENNQAGGGGGIRNDGGGTLFLTNGAIENNAASLFNIANGGGIQNIGTATLERTTISNNTARLWGGGISNLGIMNMTNSTISGNIAEESGACNAGGCLGGGIYNDNLLALANVTLVNNEATIDGGGLFDDAFISGVQVENTIFANNIASGSANNCAFLSAGFTSFGYNIEDAHSCSLTGTGDTVNTDPILGPLQDNGGFSETHALLTGSPAIEGGNPHGCLDINNIPETLTTDQRGFARPFDGDQDNTPRCDIGAYEFDRNNILNVVAAAEPFRLMWQEVPGASGYLAYRGNMGDLASGGYGTCQTTGGDLTVIEFQDPTAPALGDFSFYLVAARVNGQEWTIGFDSLGSERMLQSGAECP